MAIRTQGSVYPTDPLSAILLLRRKDPPCSNPGPCLACRPFPHALAAVPSLPALPARNLQPCSCGAPPHLCHPLDLWRRLLSFPPSFIISSCLSLHLPWSSGSPDSIIARHPALSLQLFTASHHIKSSSGPDRVGPRCAIAMFYFGLGPAGGNTNLPRYLTPRVPKALHRPTCPTHDNSPSW